MTKQRIIKLLMVWLLVIALSTQTFGVIALSDDYDLIKGEETLQDVEQGYDVLTGEPDTAWNSNPC